MGKTDGWLLSIAEFTFPKCRNRSSVGSYQEPARPAETLRWNNILLCLGVTANKKQYNTKFRLLHFDFAVVNTGYFSVPIASSFVFLVLLWKWSKAVRSTCFHISNYKNKEPYLEIKAWKYVQHTAKIYSHQPEMASEPQLLVVQINYHNRKKKIPSEIAFVAVEDYRIV